jgi:uncharacterized membrane protein YbhN (UPF0104 family)
VPGEATDSRQPASAALPSEALGAAPGPRSVLLKVASAALSGGLIVLLFVAIIPQVADFSAVWSSISSIMPGTVLLLLIAALLIRVLLAQAYVVLIPGLSFGHSLIAREASSAVSNVVPGPSGTASQFIILRSWGVGAVDFARATIAVSLTTDVLIFAAPGAFFVGWALLGMPGSSGSHDAWVVGLIAVVVSVASVAVVAAVGSSERLAALVGRIGQASVNPFRRVAGKAPVTDWPDRCMALRTDTAEQLEVRGGPLIGCVLGGYLVNGLLLVACIRACGVSGAQLPLTLGLLLYSVGRLSTVISITPGGVGVVEVAYTAVYVVVLGDSAHNSVVAGVLVYRALTYLLPILTGAVAYVVWRVQRRRAKHAAAATA